MDEIAPILIITILIFLIFRELVCWYWKLNRIVSALEDIRAELKGLDLPVKIKKAKML